MTENAPKLLTAEDVHARVIECRDMAKLAQYPEHRIMLDHMAGRWSGSLAPWTTAKPPPDLMSAVGT